MKNEYFFKFTYDLPFEKSPIGFIGRISVLSKDQTGYSSLVENEIKQRYTEAKNIRNIIKISRFTFSLVEFGQRS